MAIAKGKESAEAREFKRYIGVTPVFVKAVCPNKAEHEALFNTQLDEVPNYLGKVSDADGNEFENARISIVFQPDVEKIGFEMPLVTMALFIQNRARVGATSGKIQVIDKYGRTAWATQEEFNAKKIPTYSNGPAEIDADYRAAYVGEEELMAFVKAYLCIPNLTTWDNTTRKMVPNTKVKPEECECRFDNLEKIFKGDFSEIKDALGYQPTNKVKIVLGVRTDAENGRLYQTVYTRKFINNAATNYSALDKQLQEEINNAEQNGRTISTQYEAVPVHEYSVEPTSFTPNTEAAPSGDMPFDGESNSSTPWD